MNQSTRQDQTHISSANHSDSFVESSGLSEKDASTKNGVDNDLPQAITKSYGTGVKEISSFEGSGYALNDQDSNEASPELTGGDVDANYEQAYAEGDESVGGTVVTPDIDIVDELGKAVGLEMHDANFLHTEEILEQRDDRRWELEPKSSEDYQKRRDEELID